MSARKRAKRKALPAGRQAKPAPQEESGEAGQASSEVAPSQPAPATTVVSTPAAAAVPTVTQTESPPETPAAGEAASSSEEPIVQEESLLAQDADQQEGGSGVKKMLLWLVLFVLLVIVIGGIAFFAYQLGLQNGQELAKKEASTITPTAAAEPTEAPEEVDKGAYSIQVLNGSGVSGEAARAKDLLEAEDFVVTDIGNADSDDNKETIIAKKKDVDDKYLAELKKVLETAYTLGDTKELDEDADDAIVITVGTPLEEE